MCGIFGIAYRAGAPLALGPVLRKALERLEYRGYDSVGVAIMAHTNSESVQVYKDVGKVGEVVGKYSIDSLRGVAGIAHTRWATHGRPSRENAHPHVDCTGAVAVVHNGIIQNYAEIRERLVAAGHTFRSETDTEVIPHLIEEYMKTLPPWEAFKEAVAQLRGAFAIVALIASTPHTLYFARRLSPLVVGIAEDSAVVASDLPTVLDHTRRVVVLHDDEYGYTAPGEVHVERGGAPVDLAGRVVEISWTADMASKEGYPHYMLKEIHEQPMALAGTLSGLDWDILRAAAEALRDARHVYIVAAGTSLHAGHVMALGLARLGVKATPVVASEVHSVVGAVGEGDLGVAISQSGETIDTLVAVRALRGAGARVMAITNVVGSSVARESDLVIYTRAGPEVAVAATKTFTTQVLVVNALLHALAEAVGNGDITYVGDNMQRVPHMVSRVLQLTEGPIRELSRAVAGRASAYYLGRGLGLPVAMEGALKLKEVAYIHAEAYPAGESKHGPIALVADGFPVVFVFLDREVEKALMGNVMEMRARDATTIGLIPPGASHLAELFDIYVEVPYLDPYNNVILYVVPLQLLAYYAAVHRGYDPDKPRNLAKTVTVE